MHQYAMSEYTCTTAVLHIELDKTSIWYQKEGGRKNIYNKAEKKYTTNSHLDEKHKICLANLSYYVKMLDYLCYLSQM